MRPAVRGRCRGLRAGQPGPAPATTWCWAAWRSSSSTSGSLYHDDVMDEAVTRRGVESVNARWGNLKAILAGDFLLARASEIAASLGTEVAGLLAATIGRLCEGEVRELRGAFDVDRTEDALPRARSTARRPRCSRPRAASAASSAGLPRDARRRAHRRSATPTAWRSRSSTTSSTSSPPTSSSASPPATTWSRASTPCRCCGRSPGPSGDELRDLLGKPIEGTDVERARQLVQRGTAVDEAIDEARDWCGRAVASVADFADRPGAVALVGVADHLTDALVTLRG